MNNLPKTEQTTNQIDSNKEFTSANPLLSSKENYEHTYLNSINNSDEFWNCIAEKLFWFKKWDAVYNQKFTNPKWFVNAKTNISFNCLDRHISTWRKNKAAIIWEGESGESRILTYQILSDEVNRFAGVLKSIGVKKGDVVIIFMGNIPESIIAMLACSRIGAVHCVIAAVTTVESLRKKIEDSESKFIITADSSFRKGTVIPLKQNLDLAIGSNERIQKVIVHKRNSESNLIMHSGRDIWWHDEIKNSSDFIKARELDSEQPLFIIYSAGQLDNPLGLVHSSAGFMVQNYISFQWLFGIREDDVFWCTSDISSIEAHAYSVYGALLNGATTVLYEGLPNYPEPDRFWKIISTYKINVFITLPTNVRAFQKIGTLWMNNNDISSLRLIAVTGESIEEETMKWFFEEVGQKKCQLINFWIQSESGSALFSSFVNNERPLCKNCGSPLPGIEHAVLNKKREILRNDMTGYLVLLKSFPSIVRSVNNNKKYIKEFYYNYFKDFFFTGDAAQKINHNEIKIIGRVDSVVKIAGIRISIAEVESSLGLIEGINDAAVICKPDEIKNNALVVFVSLKENVEASLLFKEEIRNHIVNTVDIAAKPDEIFFIKQIPKTESGKIDRKHLREVVLLNTDKKLQNKIDEYLQLENLFIDN